jgi:hypothetical protein
MGTNNTQSKQMTREEVNKYLDSYFTKLETEIVGALRSQIYCGVFKTADDTNLHFPDEVLELTDIQVGMIVTLDDGKKADGDYVMPDGKVLRIKEGVLKKIIPPTPEEMQARFNKTVEEIRASMDNFRKEVRAITGRRPFKKSSK